MIFLCGIAKPAKQNRESCLFDISMVAFLIYVETNK